MKYRIQKYKLIIGGIKYYPEYKEKGWGKKWQKPIIQCDTEEDAIKLIEKWKQEGHPPSPGTIGYIKYS